MVPNQVSNNLRKTSNFTNTLEMELWRPLFAQYLVNILTVICLHPWLHQLLLTGPDCFHRHHSPAPILPHRIRPLFFFFFDKLTFFIFSTPEPNPKVVLLLWNPLEMNAEATFKVSGRPKWAKKVSDLYFWRCVAL